MSDQGGDGADQRVSWHPPAGVLEVLELVLTGALSALPALAQPPPELVAAGAPGGLVVRDAEGTPVAVFAGGRLRPARAFGHGPLRSCRRRPEQVRAELAGARQRPGDELAGARQRPGDELAGARQRPGDELAGAGPVLGVAVAGALTFADVEQVRRRVGSSGAVPLWFALVGPGRMVDLPAEAVWRAVLGAQADVGGGLAVPLALPAPGPQQAAGAGDRLLEEVARAYGADELLVPAAAAGAALHAASAQELERARPLPHRRGVTVLLTGLSGSGKSTIARALAERLLVHGRRSVSLLDGDEVRRLLSSGLGFGRADRDLNIRRIGFLAAEITRHGGVAVCAPIAPFDPVRREVRQRVEAVGDFVLVHVCTPLEECERRDRKGLYARARQGLIEDFTGISSPYEEPTDAQLRIDTTGVAVHEAVDRVWDLLGRRGYLGDNWSDIEPMGVPSGRNPAG